MIRTADDVLTLMIDRDEAQLLANQFRGLFKCHGISDDDIDRFWPDVMGIVRKLEHCEKCRQKEAQAREV